MITLLPHQVRIYYQHTDAGGFVYNARYLEFLEQARTELLRALGFAQSQIRNEHGVLFVVKTYHVDYLKPSKLDDLLWVHTSVTDIKGASVTMHQRITPAEQPDTLLLNSHVKLACINLDGRPTALPQEIREKLSRCTSIDR